jgi:hypothetical protein
LLGGFGVLFVIDVFVQGTVNINEQVSLQWVDLGNELHHGVQFVLGTELDEDVCIEVSEVDSEVLASGRHRLFQTLLEHVSTRMALIDFLGVVAGRFRLPARANMPSFSPV